MAARGTAAGLRDVGVAKAIAVRICVPDGGIFSIWLIDDLVAVIVDAVTQLTGVGRARPILVVAVRAVVDVEVRTRAACLRGLGVSVAVIVSVEVPDCGICGVCVDSAVTVIVQLVTDLCRARVDGGVVIVAVD